MIRLSGQTIRHCSKMAVYRLPFLPRYQFWGSVCLRWAIKRANKDIQRERERERERSLHASSPTFTAFTGFVSSVERVWTLSPEQLWVKSQPFIKRTPPGGVGLLGTRQSHPPRRLPWNPSILPPPLPLHPKQIRTEEGFTRANSSWVMRAWGGVSTGRTILRNDNVRCFPFL